MPVEVELSTFIILDTMQHWNNLMYFMYAIIGNLHTYRMQYTHTVEILNITILHDYTQACHLNLQHLKTFFTGGCNKCRIIILIRKR